MLFGRFLWAAGRVVESEAQSGAGGGSRHSRSPHAGRAQPLEPLLRKLAQERECQALGCSSETLGGFES
eukprot:1760466-Rhodomonas_salina.9